MSIQTSIHEQLARPIITDALRQAAGDPHIEPADWHYEALKPGVGSATAGIWRIIVNANGAQWPLILKIISAAETGLSPAGQAISHPLYWKREALAYQSGLLDTLPGAVTAPRCYAVMERAEDTIWLWLEDVSDSGALWSLEHYARAAWHIGRLNGASINRTLPYPWLNRAGSPRGLLEAFKWLEPVIADPQVWTHALLQEAFPIPVQDRLLRLWQDRHRCIDHFESLPQTLCHMDAWQRNMFLRESQLVLIDWAYTGYGTLGTDAADLFAASYHMLEVEICEPDVMAATIFKGYMAGLRDSGWHGDESDVRFAFQVFAALKYAGILLWLADIQNPDRLAFWETLSSQPINTFLQQQARLIYYLLDQFEEAQHAIA